MYRNNDDMVDLSMNFCENGEHIHAYDIQVFDNHAFKEMHDNQKQVFGNPVIEPTGVASSRLANYQLTRDRNLGQEDTTLSMHIWYNIVLI